MQEELIYRAVDGEIFKTESECLEHERRVFNSSAIYELLYKELFTLVGDFRVDAAHQRMLHKFVNWLIDHPQTVIDEILPRIIN